MGQTSARAELTSASRIVIKIGSNLVATSEGVINYDLLNSVVAEIAELSSAGHEVLLVTSGAVRVGLAKMGLVGGPKPDLSTRQAAAAVGQVELIACYNDLFGRYGCTVGQLLLTGDDIADRRRYLHIRNTLLPMLSRHQVIPVINENDSVSVKGVQIGENDRLAALIAGKVECDLLIILSDVEGFYTGDPRLNAAATLVHEITEITPEVITMAGGSTSGVGRGGMRSKLLAAKTATRMGTHTVVALGRHPHVISRILAGEELGTLFVAGEEGRLNAWKHWLGYAATPHGSLLVDAGAKRAIVENHSSLLPVGICGVEGAFQAGDVVAVRDPDGQEVARGLVNYSASELRQIAGEKTAQIETILGYHPYDEAIHCDNLILM